MEEDVFAGIIEYNQKSPPWQKGFPVDCESGRNAKGPNRQAEKSCSVVKLSTEASGLFEESQIVWTLYEKPPLLLRVQPLICPKRH